MFRPEAIFRSRTARGENANQDRRRQNEKNEKFHASERITGRRKKTKNLRKKRKIQASERITGRRKRTKNLRKKTKNVNRRTGRQRGGNPRKIHERSKTLEKDAKGAKPRGCERTKKNTKNVKRLCFSRGYPPIHPEINATNPGPLKILEETKKTKKFRFLRKIYEKSQSEVRKLTKNELSC